MDAMRPIPRIALPLLLVLPFAGCMTPDYTSDLAKNDLLYTDVEFATKAPGDRAVFIAPVTDVRKVDNLPTVDHGCPIVYGGDDFWERPVSDMIGDVLERQVASSGLFAAVAPQASANALVIKPQVVSFLVGAIDGVAGTSSFAEVGLRLTVYGPADATGKRAVLHDTIYASRQSTDRQLSPISPYRLVGRALQVSMTKALSGLDGSNVGRSNVPLDLSDPALPTSKPTEASSPR